MKLVQINSGANTGSTGRIAEQIGATALRRGYSSSIAYGRHAQPGASDHYRVGGLVNTLLHGAESLLLDRHGLGSKRATKRMVDWIQAHEPDAIGLHNIHGYFLNYPILFDFLRYARIPTVWTLHDCWPLTGHCAYFDRFDCMKWQDECHDCPMTNYYPRSIVDFSRRNYRLKKSVFHGIPGLVVVTPSKWLGEIVKKSFLSEYPVKVIHNGIDLSVFKPGKQCIADNVVLGVANVWDDRKGLRDFVTLRELLPRSFQIVLVGVSKSQKGQLPAGIVGIEKTGSVQELARWYQKAAVFVNPTYSDNFPTTNLEALACGRPVVTYDVGGSPESLDHETGRVIRPGDTEGLARGIEELVQGDREAISHKCRSRAEAFFNKDDRFSDYVDLYEALVGGYDTGSRILSDWSRKREA